MGATFGARVRGNVLNLVRHVKPTAEKTRADYPDLHGSKLLNKVTEANVWKTIEDLLARSEICRDAVGRGRMQLIGAIYDIKSGRVEWLGPHPNEYELVTAGR